MPLQPLTLQRLSALYGLTADGLGAFGAHGLQARGITGARQLESWKTASTYLLAHAIALLALSGRSAATAATQSVNGKGGVSVGRYTAELFAVGAAMFSGSIYGLVLGSGASSEGIMGWMSKILGPMTPVGGSLMILGWVSMLF